MLHQRRRICKNVHQIFKKPLSHHQIQLNKQTKLQLFHITTSSISAIPYSSSPVKSPYSHIPLLSSLASFSLSLSRANTCSPTLPISHGFNFLGTMANPSPTSSAFKLSSTLSLRPASNNVTHNPPSRSTKSTLATSCFPSVSRASQAIASSKYSADPGNWQKLNMASVACGLSAATPKDSFPSGRRSVQDKT